MCATWARVCVGALFCGASCVVLQTGAAVLAIAQPGEQVLGVSRGAMPSQSGERSRGAGPAQADAVAPHAEQLLEAARQDLVLGNPLEGRRRLEILVATYPDTPAADDARQELARIYAQEAGRGPAQIGRAMPASSRTKEVSRVPDQPVSRRISLGQASASGDPALANRREAARTRISEQEFRARVGDRVFFGDRSADLGDRAAAVIAAQARWLRRAQWVSVVIEGYADDEGSNDFNERLAKRRALAVRARLIEEGVDGGRIAIESRGRFQPIAICSFAECAAQNRRAVTVLRGARSATLPGEQRGTADR